MIDTGKLLQRNGYRIKIFNTINFKKSMHYNPFAYIHSEKDILKLVTTLISNTKGEQKGGDEFWTKAETLLYDLLIIDDLGVERGTEYALEQMFSIIDSRYRSGKPLIVTTNLKLDEIKHPPDLAHTRIYDRILERCAPILFAGKNFREDNAASTKAAARKIITDQK